MKSILYWLLGLSLATLWLFNFSAGIIGGIWLIALGNFWFVIFCIIISFIMPYIYALVMLPSLLLAPLLSKAIEKENRFFTVVLGFIAGGYSNFLLALWATYVFGFVVLSNNFPLTPALLLGYAITMGAIGSMARGEGPDAGSGTTFGVLFVQVCYLIMTISTIVGKPDVGYAWIWLLWFLYTIIITMLIGVSIPKRKGGQIILDQNLQNFIFDKKPVDPLINEEADEIYQDVKEFIKDKRQIAISELQEKFDIGYTRVAMIMDHLEKDGIVASPIGNQPRKVLISWKTNDQELDSQGMMIVEILRSFGLETRIEEINKKRNGIEYCLDVAVGFPLEEVIKRQREIALAVASPTGKVKIEAPIPGRALIGITVPFRKS